METLDKAREQFRAKKLAANIFHMQDCLESHFDSLQELAARDENRELLSVPDVYYQDLIDGFYADWRELLMPEIPPPPLPADYSTHQLAITTIVTMLATLQEFQKDPEQDSPSIQLVGDTWHLRFENERGELPEKRQSVYRMVGSAARTSQSTIYRRQTTRRPRWQAVRRRSDSGRW